ncbi:MAG: DUF2283 domain-containing protein [Chloroflexi bacterium]|nr:DUF2283 domain-containing protein [Chloroflexota bacterium]
MNFLIDATLPRRITLIFQERGHTAVHTLELPEGSATADSALLDYDEKGNLVSLEILDASRRVNVPSKIKYQVSPVAG